jgi:hypothetical protein
LGQRIVPEAIVLTDEQFAYLNEKYPPSGAKASNHTTGDRAAHIARIFLEDLYPGCTFVPQTPGADLAIRDPHINVEDQIAYFGERDHGFRLNVISESGGR